MATGKQVIARLAPLLGLRPTTLERQLRAQRLAGDLPTGLPGGHSGSAHFTAQHLTTVLLGLTGPEPSDAPAATVALRSMPYQGSTNPPPGVKQVLPTTLEDQLADWIGVIAEAHRIGDKAIAATFQDWEISLCLRPRRAWIQVGRAGGQENVIIYANEQPQFAMTRATIFSGEVMLALGELLADTIEQTSAIACMQFLASTQPAKAGAKQERENAGNLRQEAPALVTNPASTGPTRTQTPRKVSA